MTDESFIEYEREVDEGLEEPIEPDNAVEVSDLTAIMSLVSGRRFIMRQLLAAGVDSYTFANDAAVHGFNAGRQSIGLDLQHDVKTHCFGEYLLMLKENEHGD